MLKQLFTVACLGRTYKLNFSAIFKKIISAHMENMPNGEKSFEI